MARGTKYHPDYRISIISACGFIGLLTGLLVLSREADKNHTGSVFHEIDYSPRQAAGHALEFVIDSLKGAHKDSTTVATLSSYKSFYEDAPQSDTGSLATLNKWLYFQITPDDILKWDAAYDRIGKDWSTDVPYYAKFTANNKLFSHRDKIQFKIKPYSGNLQFIMKYPGVGIWTFFMLLFCAFCFIVVPAALYIRKQVLLTFKPERGSDKNGYWWSVVIVAICFVLLYLTIFNTFSDEMPVKGLFFMRTLYGILIFVNVIGGISGSFSLAGFIHSASMLGHFAIKLREGSCNIVSERAKVQTTDDSSKEVAKVALSHMVQAHEDRVDQFRRLLGFFHRYFILSAIQLSLTVLVTGALHNAANSLDFVKLLVARWGYTPASGDAVYLYGGLYTVILLLVYLPAKMQFGDVQLQLPPDPNAPKKDDGSWYSFLQQPFSLLKGSLIAATPFLSGVVQSLLDAVFKH
jgi:hypothetical protein